MLSDLNNAPFSLLKYSINMLNTNENINPISVTSIVFLTVCIFYCLFTLILNLPSPILMRNI